MPAVKSVCAIYIIPLTIGLGGCSLITSPIATSVQMASSAVSMVSNMAPNIGTSAVVFQKDKTSAVCIEWNSQVIASDFLPELQRQLQAMSIASRVYDAGMAPGDCPEIMKYDVRTKWATPLFSDNAAPYISDINLFLKQGGKVVATAAYSVDSLAYDKWTSTPKKLAPLLQKMFAAESAAAEQPAAKARPVITRN